MEQVFRNREAAGLALIEPLRDVVGDRKDILVLGLPRGGVPVAWEVARGLGAELDVLVVRKLGLPQHPELAMGAIASGGARILNTEVMLHGRVTRAQLDLVERQEQAELSRREKLFRGDRDPIRVKDRRVILVDDGAATGATMEAAVQAVRSLQPREVIVAVPVASRDACARLDQIADEVVCLKVPRDFQAVGRWYEFFNQVDELEVESLLAQARKWTAA